MTRGQIFARSATLTSVIVVFLGFATPAAAFHTVTMEERDPPEEAYESEPLELELEVKSTCVIPDPEVCGGVYVKLTYIYPFEDGTRSRVVFEVLPHVGGVARFTIPGDHVIKPEIRYEFQVTQSGHCYPQPCVPPFCGCDTAGSFTSERRVPVL